MDLTDAQTLVGLDRTDSTLSNTGESIDLPSRNDSREAAAEAFLEKEGGKIHPIFRSDTGSSQAPGSATTSDTVE